MRTLIVVLFFFQSLSYGQKIEIGNENPFDHDYTKLSADSEGMFFNLHMKGLQPERYYRVLFRSIINNQDTVIYDDNYYFKIIR